MLQFNLLCLQEKMIGCTVASTMIQCYAVKFLNQIQKVYPGCVNKIAFVNSYV